MNLKKAVTIGVAVASAVAVVVVSMPGKSVQPHAESFTFVRNVCSDEGGNLDPLNVVSKEGVRLDDVFSTERVAMYSGYDPKYDGKPFGVGLKVSFVWECTNRKESFEIEVAENENNNDLRDSLVQHKKAEFATTVAKFVGPVPIKRAFGFTLDVTEGVDSLLVKRFREEFENRRVAKLANDSNSIRLNLYQISTLPSQGGRQQPNPKSAVEMAASMGWLLKARPGEIHTSVLLGLAADAEEMASYKDERPVLVVFTDGLENTSALSVYQTPKVLDDSAGWSKLDQIVDIASLKLAGLEVHLYPLSAKSPRHAGMMKKALAYIADRLEKAGAAVTVHPL